MKKSLLLASALLCASSMMGASVTQRSTTAVRLQDNSTQVAMPQATAEYAEMATPGAPAVRKVRAKADDGTPKAFYRRPAGAFYGLCTVIDGNMTYSSYYAPYLMGWPFADATYKQMAVNIGENPQYNWTYQIYDRPNKTCPWLTAEGPELTVNYANNNEVDSVPTLLAKGTEAEVEFTLGGWSTTGSGSSKTINKRYVSQYVASTDFRTTFSNSSDRTLFCTSKFRAASTNRDATNLSGGTYLTGAKDAEGGTSGKWYGRNYTGIEALAMAFEKPEHPYVLRKVGVAFQNLSLTGTDPCDLKVRVYKLDEIPAYNDTASVYVEPTEIVGEGTYTIDPATWGDATSGMLQFDLQISDEESGFTFNIEPEIDFPILVVFTDYNNATISDITLTQSTDLYDEGFGELCYMGRAQEDGSIKYQGLNYFFRSGERKSGISIYIDAVRPHMVWNYNNETGEYQFPNEGGDHSVEVYCYNQAEEWEITMEDGSEELPAWLSVSLADKLNDSNEWGGVVNINATAQPLPEGTDYREAKVKFAINGNSVVYTYTQGEKPEAPENPCDVNGDGTVDITDVNITINVMLGKVDKTQYPVSDVNGDGTVDITDVNLIINAMLGK